MFTFLNDDMITMSDDLIAREKEFRRINRELDERTKHILAEIDTVVNSTTRNVFLSGNSATFRPQLSTAYDDFYAEPPMDRCNLDCGRKIEDIMQEKMSTTSETPTDDKKNEDDLLTFDDDEKKPKNDTVIRFLKAKIKMCLSEMETMKDAYKKRCNYCKDLEIENKKLNDTKEKLQNQLINTKEIIAKHETSIANHQSELQTNSTEKSALKKEIDSLKKDIKTLNQQTNNFDLRLNRSIEENEKLKATIKMQKIEEKELRIQIRRLQDDERQSLKSLERRYTELTQAFKKQSLLVDNLKKQKAYLEASKLIELTREEFLKILNATNNLHK